jgi:hypothetical protein
MGCLGTMMCIEPRCCCHLAMRYIWSMQHTSQCLMSNSCLAIWLTCTTYYIDGPVFPSFLLLLTHFLHLRIRLLSNFKRSREPTMFWTNINFLVCIFPSIMFGLKIINRSNAQVNSAHAWIVYLPAFFSYFTTIFIWFFGENCPW